MKLLSVLIVTTLFNICLSQSENDHLKEQLPEGYTWEKAHMKLEHDLDEYDASTFFALHDLKSKGYLDSTDILSLYGLLRDEVVGRGDGMGSHDDSENIDPQLKVEVVTKIFKLVDADSDEKITREEYLTFAEKGGEFPDLNVGIGHSQDFEKEYEIHHWIKYHKDQDPEIKVVHKEDIEHELLHHEHEIEHENDYPTGKFYSDDQLEKQINLNNIPNKYRHS
ncbi:hypothetical protein WICMUC_003576 [Wickerhamomyces mucosus]|uniref:EF-hand domain-containing protein n=1 Tax=Wickerhamomyces mucosus TaxID=1378264 RepID=A0A9P8PK73_9ASCO|nr:hypothetical protein WICMUC_003576 [Wickerhamomyces mucosus]